MKNVLLTVTLGLAVSACTSPDSAKRVLEAQGYTNIKTGGYALWACSEDDAFATKFTATSVSGNTVTGAVCSGWFKGNTIRVD